MNKEFVGFFLFILISWIDLEEESKYMKLDLRLEIKILVIINDGVYWIILKVKKLVCIVVYIKYWKGVV